MYNIKYTKQAVKDIDKLKQSNLAIKAKRLVNIIKENQFQNPPPYEKLTGDLNGLYSRRINIQHYLIYEIFQDKYIIKIISMWSNYEYLRFLKKT